MFLKYQFPDGDFDKSQRGYEILDGVGLNWGYLKGHWGSLSIGLLQKVVSDLCKCIKFVRDCKDSKYKDFKLE